MRPRFPFPRTALAAPVLLAISGPILSVGPAASAQGPSKTTPSSQISGGYPSYFAGSGSLPPLPTSQGATSPPNTPLPAIGQVTTPYPSSGPASLSGLATSQSGMISGQSGPSYLAGGGSMGVPSPYESTAAPGTSSPYAPPAGGGAGGGSGPGSGSGSGSGGPVSPFQAAANGGPEANPFGGSAGALASGLGGIAGVPLGAFAMIGDASPPISISASNPPGLPNPNLRSKIAPSVRGFKIAENQSPVPQDRFFFSFNYYNNVNKTLDRFFEAQIKDVEIYRYVFGYEKTFNQGMGSVGIRLPIDNVYAKSNVPTLKQGGTSTSLGDLTVYLKHIFAINRETGSLATGGVAITPQTAPGHFGGAQFLNPSNTTSIQPFFAYLFKRDRFYLQGFSALDVPVDPAQPTLFYNDIGVGYFVYQDQTFRNFITAIAPTVEVHVNNPINHSGAYNRLDSNGTPDIVNITSGLNTRFGSSSILTMGVVTPVTGPRPFSIEATVLLNVYFGRSRPNPAPPIIGG